MIPFDPEAERAVIAAMLTNAPDRDRILSRLTAADFHDHHHASAFSAIARLYECGQKIDPNAIVHEARAQGDHLEAQKLRDTLTSLATFPGPSIDIVADMAWRRRLMGAGSAIVDRAQDLTSDTGELAGYAIDTIDRAQAPVPVVDEVTDVATLAQEEHTHDWLVPNLLERGDRLILTAGEGTGKSLALRSWGLMLASGIHPFTLARIQPLRVLLVDLENSRAQAGRSLQGLLRNAPYTPGRMGFVSFLAGLDVRDQRDWCRLDALVQGHKADLLIIGPLYKAFRTRKGESKNDETAAEEAAYAFDRIRARHGCALWIEAHAPHGDAGDRAGLRPYGASLWMRWPEFGFGMKRENDSIGGKRIVELRPWRGVREWGRDWPARLIEGEVWPWMPTG